MKKIDEFNDMYKNEYLKDIKWTELYIHPKMMEELYTLNKFSKIKIMDIGCGSSLDSLYYTSKGNDVLCVDSSSGALKKLEALFNLYGFTFNYLNESIFDLKLNKKLKENFDVITDNGLFHHIDKEDYIKYLTSVYYCLKTDGILYIRCHSEFNLDSTDNKLIANRINSDDIIDLYFSKFHILELSTYPVYVEERNITYKMWFIKLKKRQEINIFRR